MHREPVNPHGFDEHKLAVEERGKTVDRINVYQADTRQRVDTLIKSVLVLSGGALTISIGIFLREKAPHLNDELMHVLQFSWGLIFYALAASVIVTFFMICQGYYFGELWKKMLGSGEDAISKNRVLFVSRVLNWFFGITGLIAFLAGLGALAYVSIKAIS